MLLGFKRRFEAPVLAKTKRHTIRAKRKGKRQWRVGDICDCCVDSRQKTMRMFGRWPCVRVQDIRIEGGWETHTGDFFGAIHVDDNRLSHDECELLAQADGFESYAEMMEFWRGRLPFHGDLIHWNPDVEVPAKRSKRPSEAAALGNAATDPKASSQTKEEF